MKKYLILLTLLFSSLFAETRNSLNLGINWADFRYENERLSGNTYMIGYSFDSMDKNLYWGLSFDALYSDKENYMFGISTDVKLGMQLTPRVAVYGIGSAMKQGFQNGTSGYGFGYGGGMTTFFTKSFASYIEYKTYDMVETNANPGDYYYDSLNIGMKFRF